MNEKLKKITQGLVQSLEDRLSEVQHFDNSPLPDKAEIAKILEDALALLFPGYYGRELSFDSIEYEIGLQVARLFEKLRAQVLREALHLCRLNKKSCQNCHQYSDQIAEALVSEISTLRDALELDVKAAFRNDPAASGFDEIIFSYPGFLAVAVYRIAHFLHQKGLVLLPRIMTEWAHSQTGVDIHPGATIGEGFFIDHATGVVIGETTLIGDHVTVYQGVTLGALNFPRDAAGNIIRGAKRHPTLEDDVVIYAGATILGGETVIGKGSVVGGNVWLTESVPPNTRVLVAKPELRITTRREIGCNLRNPPTLAPPTCPGKEQSRGAEKKAKL